MSASDPVAMAVVIAVGAALGLFIWAVIHWEIQGRRNYLLFALEQLSIKQVRAWDDTPDEHFRIVDWPGRGDLIRTRSLIEGKYYGMEAWVKAKDVALKSHIVRFQR